jgi:hypothetical protein
MQPFDLLTIKDLQRRQRIPELAKGQVQQGRSGSRLTPFASTRP